MHFETWILTLFHYIQNFTTVNLNSVSVLANSRVNVPTRNLRVCLCIIVKQFTDEVHKHQICQQVTDCGAVGRVKDCEYEICGFESSKELTFFICILKEHEKSDVATSKSKRKMKRGGLWASLYTGSRVETDAIFHEQIWRLNTSMSVHSCVIMILQL